MTSLLCLCLLASMASVYFNNVDADLVPPAGVRFRIYSASDYIKKMLIADITCEKDGLLSADQEGKEWFYDGSWFRVEDCPGFPGYYYVTALRNPDCVIFGNGTAHKAGLADHHKISFSKDQCWMFVFNEYNEFQLVNLYLAGRLWLRTTYKPYVGVVLKSALKFRDQFFRFHFETLVFQSLKFYLDKGVVQANPPKNAAEQVFTSNSTIEQSQAFSVRYKQQKQESWEYTSGFRITAEMGLLFKAKVPLFGESERAIKLGAEIVHQWTTKTITTESRENTYIAPVKIPPWRKVIAKVMIHEAKGEVPYEMTLLTKGSRKELKSYGKWKGVQTMNVQTDIQEINLLGHK